MCCVFSYLSAESENTLVLFTRTTPQHAPNNTIDTRGNKHNTVPSTTRQTNYKTQGLADMQKTPDVISPNMTGGESLNLMWCDSTATTCYSLALVCLSKQHHLPAVRLPPLSPHLSDTCPLRLHTPTTHTNKRSDVHIQLLVHAFCVDGAAPQLPLAHVSCQQRDGAAVSVE